MKRFDIRYTFVIFVLFVCFLAGCTPNTSDEPLLKNNPLFEVYVTSLNVEPDASLSESMLCTVNHPDQVIEMMLMFNDWVPEDNKANTGIDGWPNYRIHFGSLQSISYFYPGHKLGYICLIDNRYYYLPEAYGQYLDSLIASYLE